MKRISYAELAKNENIIYFGNAPQFDLEPYSGVDYDEETDTYEEIYQFYLIEESFAQYLARATSEIVYFCPELELYVWGCNALRNSLVRSISRCQDLRRNDG